MRLTAASALDLIPGSPAPSCNGPASRRVRNPAQYLRAFKWRDGQHRPPLGLTQIRHVLHGASLANRKTFTTLKEAQIVFESRRRHCRAACDRTPRSATSRLFRNEPPAPEIVAPCLPTHSAFGRPEYLRHRENSIARGRPPAEHSVQAAYLKKHGLIAPRPPHIFPAPQATSIRQRR